MVNTMSTKPETTGYERKQLRFETWSLKDAQTTVVELSSEMFEGEPLDADKDAAMPPPTIVQGYVIDNNGVKSDTVRQFILPTLAVNQLTQIEGSLIGQIVEFDVAGELTKAKNGRNFRQVTVTLLVPKTGK